MKITSYALARPAYYDRSAASVLSTYSATPGPHAFTTRFTYTVGAGKKLALEAASVRVLRATTATVAGAYYAQIATFVGADAQLICYGFSNVNTLVAPIFQTMTTQATIYAGEAIQAATYDDSTGGTINHLASVKGTLFDA